MPELRQDPVTESWVVIATERAKRPESFASKKTKEDKDNTICPFCCGNEALTPPEVFALRPAETKPGTKGWKVRIVPNKYPAFTKKCSLETSPKQMFICTAARGFHEVIISSPDHKKSLAELPTDQVELVVDAYVKRYQQIKKDKSVKYILIIVNHGKSAGASLAHPHSQLFAVPVMPSRIEEELVKTKNYLKTKGSCVFCCMTKAETSERSRLVGESNYFVSFMPYASRLPFETWIVPKEHRPSFETLAKEEQKDFAQILREVLARLHKSLNNPPYNLFIHTSPSNQTTAEENFSKSYHWHVEIIPKLTTPAGFEMGTGIMINVAKPEDAAKLLRETEISG